jgi:hypothetical protein
MVDVLLQSLEAFYSLLEEAERKAKGDSTSNSGRRERRDRDRERNRDYDDRRSTKSFKRPDRDSNLLRRPLVIVEIIMIPSVRRRGIVIEIRAG